MRRLVLRELQKTLGFCIFVSPELSVLPGTRELLRRHLSSKQIAGHESILRAIQSLSPLPNA